jgi:ligand-binding SRPBCC domain-containing protein
MAYLKIETIIRAPIERCFDLSRSVDLHKYSLSHTGEEAIAGITSGLMKLDDLVTWRARHFGIVQTFTSRITRYNPPKSFRDSMVPGSGAFARFDHDHIFEALDAESTRMIDLLDWDCPLGWLGDLADALFVTRHMRKLIEVRNSAIKQVAESDTWQLILGGR